MEIQKTNPQIFNIQCDFTDAEAKEILEKLNDLDNAENLVGALNTLRVEIAKYL